MKGFLSVFLAVLVFVFPMLCSVTAVAEGILTIGVSSFEAKPGDMVEVPIWVKNNPGIISVKVQLAYNKEALTLEGMKAADFKGVSFSPLTNNPITVNWIDSLHGNNTTNGALATLTFRVKETALAGEYSLTITAGANDIFDYDFIPKPYTLVNGSVTLAGGQPPVVNPQEPPLDNPNDTPSDVPVVPPTNTDIPNKPTDEPLSGDLNSDDLINAKDALVVLKISVGKFIPTPAQKQLADVNKDDEINAKDALEILKYSVNKPSCLAK